MGSYFPFPLSSQHVHCYVLDVLGLVPHGIEYWNWNSACHHQAPCSAWIIAELACTTSNWYAATPVQDLHTSGNRLVSIRFSYVIHDIVGGMTLSAVCSRQCTSSRGPGRVYIELSDDSISDCIMVCSMSIEHHTQITSSHHHDTYLGPNMRSISSPIAQSKHGDTTMSPYTIHLWSAGKTSRELPSHLRSHRSLSCNLSTSQATYTGPLSILFNINYNPRLWADGTSSFFTA
jgi:hypothetical protein